MKFVRCIKKLQHDWIIFVLEDDTSLQLMFSGGLFLTLWFKAVNKFEKIPVNISMLTMKLNVPCLSKVHKKKFLPVHRFLPCFITKSKIWDHVFMASQKTLCWKIKMDCKYWKLWNLACTDKQGGLAKQGKNLSWLNFYGCSSRFKYW